MAVNFDLCFEGRT